MEEIFTNSGVFPHTDYFSESRGISNPACLGWSTTTHDLFFPFVFWPQSLKGRGPQRESEVEAPYSPCREWRRKRNRCQSFLSSLLRGCPSRDPVAPSVSKALVSVRGNLPVPLADLDTLFCRFPTQKRPLYNPHLTKGSCSEKMGDGPQPPSKRPPQEERTSNF